MCFHFLMYIFFHTIFVVQSEVASERPGILDCLREGLSRLFGWGTMPTTRLLPLWRMVPLMVLYGVSHYTIMSLAEYTVMLSIRTDMLEAQVRLEKIHSSYDRVAVFKLNG